MANNKLWELFEAGKAGYKWVDLSRELSGDTPHYGGFPDMEIEALFDFEKTDCNFKTHIYTTVGQYGTHMDAPSHFVKDGRTMDTFTPEEMVMPLCVIDLSKEVAANPDYELTVKDIESFEKTHGKIPRGAFVAFRSDWHKRLTTEEMDNKDANGQCHYPGWGIDALKFLLEEREIGAIGHEPSDTDPALVASAKGWVAEDYYLRHNRFQIEMLANLDQCPATGGIIFCTFLKVRGGSGYPARCFALVPVE